MYNRYIPQPDGSFRRDRMPSQEQQQQKQQIVAPVEHKHPSPVEEARSHPEPVSMGAAGFLRRLIPNNLDTGDLLVILLLLLMAGDGKEGSNSALLTLALYLFL